MTEEDAILDAAIKRHDLLYGMGHCDRKYILSCARLPEIILSLPKPTPEKGLGMSRSTENGRPLGEASGGDRSFWDGLGVGEDGLPVHLPIGVNEHGQGPEQDSAAYTFTCWCGDPECPLSLALGHAWASGRRVNPPGAPRNYAEARALLDASLDNVSPYEAEEES